MTSILTNAQALVFSWVFPQFYGLEPLLRRATITAIGVMQQEGGEICNPSIAIANIAQASQALVVAANSLNQGVVKHGA
jgi:hypothetical protein